MLGARPGTLDDAQQGVRDRRHQRDQRDEAPEDRSPKVMRQLGLPLSPAALPCVRGAR